MDDFAATNCVVIGISKDTPAKQAKFREKYGLTCLLGADHESDVCEQFGVWVEKSMYGKKYMGVNRSTFILNEEGIITHVFEKASPSENADDILKVLK